MSDRAGTLGALRERLLVRYPDLHELSTNETMNPATPLAVTAVWLDKYGRKKVRVVRARTIAVNHEAFTRYVMSELEAFHQGLVAAL